MNGDNYAALKAATLGAQQIQSPTSTLGASNAPELAAMYQSSFQLPQSNSATKAQSFQTGVTVDNQQQAAKMKIEELKQQAQDLADQNDPSKYEVKKKADGGYDFFDPKGNQIDIATYTQKTGLKAADVLKDSENPIDIQYREDYKNLEDLLNAVVNKDTAKLDSYEQAQPGVTKKKPQEIIEQFKKYYQRYYTPRTADPNAWGITPKAGVMVPNQSATTTAFPSLGGGNELANGL